MDYKSIVIVLPCCSLYLLWQHSNVWMGIMNQWTEKKEINETAISRAPVSKEIIAFCFKSKETHFKLGFLSLELLASTYTSWHFSTGSPKIPMSWAHCNMLFAVTWFRWRSKLKLRQEVEVTMDEIEQSPYCASNCFLIVSSHSTHVTPGICPIYS